MATIEYSKKVTEYICKVIGSKNTDDVKILQVDHLTTLADIFIIVTVSNTRMVAGMCDEIEEKLKIEGYEPISKEGYNTARWILLDYQGVMVHIFHKEEAEFYRLDRLWNDAEVLELA